MTLDIPAQVDATVPVPARRPPSPHPAPSDPALTDPAPTDPALTSAAEAGARLLERIDALPQDAWPTCPVCRTVTSGEAARAADGVCGGCGHHRRLTAPERIASLTDPGSFTELEVPVRLREDPLGFVDTVPYAERLARARSRTGLSEAVTVGTASVRGTRVVLAVMDFRFLGGSMGVAVGERLVGAAQEALAHRLPLVVVATSGGARMQEGVLALWQMARTASEFGMLREAGVPSICVLSDPVYGGVAASFASLGDVLVAEPGARAGFAGPGVIAGTIGDTLPPGFQTAEFLLEHGHVDLVVPRPQLRAVLGTLLDVAAGTDHESTEGHSTGLPEPDGVPAAPEASPEPDLSGWDAVRGTRDAARPTAATYVAQIVTGFVELHGDRQGADDPAVLAGVGRIGGRRVAVIGQSKGQAVGERVARRFGMAEPAGYAKAVRVARLAERWGLPVLTLIDTPGAYPGVAAEERNQSGAIAESMLAFSALRTPVVGVVIGEGGSGGALALAVTDRLLFLRSAVLSVISPEGCASILFGDATQAPRMAEALRIRAPDLLELGIADGVVPEPAGGCAADPEAAGHALAGAISQALEEIARDAPDPSALVHHRRERVRRRTRSTAGPTPAPAPQEETR